MLKGNNLKVIGICSDTVKINGEIVAGKDGKAMWGAIGWYRIVNPISKLGGEVLINQIVSNRPENAMYFKEKGDVWFMKIMDNENIDFIWDTHKQFTNSKIVLDLDDYPGDVDKKHPDYKAIKDRQHMRERMIKIADHVVCSTPQIANAIKDINPYTTVIPNAIDPKIWEVKKPKERKDGIVRIGWIGSASHFADMNRINPVMEEILKKYPNVHFYYAGMIREDIHDGRVHHLRGTNGYEVFPQWYADQDFDIAVAPLEDTLFNRCKSNIKWMEAAMLELPLVASDVTPYQCIQHGKTGYLAKSNSQFVKYLSWLIENPEKRIEIGKNAKVDVLENWTIDKFIPLYENLFKKIQENKDITVITAITGGKDELKKQPEYPGVEYVAFLDKDTKDSQWVTKKVCDKFAKPVMNAKIHKILMHKYADTPYLMWIDGSVTLKKDPHGLVSLMGDKNFAFFKHPGRSSIYKEGEACINLHKGDPAEITEQMKEYARKEFPDKTKMCELTAFIRKNNEKVNTLCEKWWSDITRYSNRDQISFPVIFEKEKWVTIPGSIEQLKKVKEFPGNEYLSVKLHKHYD